MRRHRIHGQPDGFIFLPTPGRTGWCRDCACLARKAAGVVGFGRRGVMLPPAVGDRRSGSGGTEGQIFPLIPPVSQNARNSGVREKGKFSLLWTGALLSVGLPLWRVTRGLLLVFHSSRLSTQAARMKSRMASGAFGMAVMYSARSQGLFVGLNSFPGFRPLPSFPLLPPLPPVLPLPIRALGKRFRGILTLSFALIRFKKG